MEVWMKSITRCALVVLFSASFAVHAYSQQVAAAFAGQVIGKDGKPMAGVLVRIDRTDIPEHREIKTDKNGKYYYGGLPNGSYRLTVEQNGLPLAVADLKVAFGDTLTKDFDLRAASATERGNTRVDTALKEAERVANQETQGAFNSGLDALNARNYDEAIKQFLAAAAKRPKDYVIYARLGQTYSEAKKYSEAAQAYQKAVELKPNDAGYYNSMAIALGAAGMIDESRAAFVKAAELDPTLGGLAYYNLGLTFIHSGNAKDAADSFRKSLSYDANNVNTYYQLGLSLLSNADTTAEALAQLEKYLKLAPTGEFANAAKQVIAAMKK